MQVAGVDIGTTTISAVVLDPEKQTVLDARTIPNGSFLPTDHPWERIQDPAILMDKAKTVLDEFLISYPGISAIGLTGQMHGIVYTDQEGKAVSPLFTWQDQRGNLPDDQGRSLTERILEKTGLHTATGFGLVTHLYQKNAGEVPQQAVCICTIPDYLGMVLTGRKKPLIHISMAASLGFFDGKTRTFLRDALSRMGENGEILPDVTGKFEAIGEYKGLPVTVAVGDNQASFLGAVGFQENTLLLNVGTGGQISVLSSEFFETEGIEARPLTEDTYLLAGSALCGGRAYAILEKFFRRYLEEAGYQADAQFDVLNRLAEKGRVLADKDPLRVDTRFQGTRSMPDLQGSILNISEDNFTPESFSYGVLEGMAQELADLFEKIRKGTGIQAKHLVASGNGVRRNKILQEIFCEKFRAELSLAKYQEEAACGAAISSKM